MSRAPIGIFDSGLGGLTVAHAIFERLPADVWKEVSPSVVSDELSQRIKRAFDPHHILNPGILGD